MTSSQRRRLAAPLAAPLALSLLWAAPALAQNASPQQIQSQIAAGQEQTALSELNTTLQAHPNSAVAWYLTAEAQDGVGNQAAARSALGKAEQIAPGLPFASPSDVAALKAHLSAAPGNAAPVAAAPARMGISPVVLLIGLAVVAFLVFGMLRRRRYNQGYQQRGYGPAAQANPYPNAPPPGYGPGYQGGGMGGMGGGIGGGLLGGLAAGAGFAAGERALDGLMGGGGGQGLGGGLGGGGQIAGGGDAPARDDGLVGNPGWDNSGDVGGGDTLASGGDNFDPGNSW